MNRDEVFSEFVAARSKALLRTAYLISGDEAMAQDLLQEGLTKTYVRCRNCATAAPSKATPAR